MEIRLNKMYLSNFKSIKEKTISFDGKNTSILGDNATGKSTLYDAFSWVLFDKNGRGVSDFAVKPYGVARPEVVAELLLNIDGKEVKLKKKLTENWTRKRGEENETLTGNTTEYYINDIPKKAGEYKAYIDSIVTEDKFKRLTSADYLLSMKKPDMRRVLIDMAGDIKDRDISEGFTDLIDTMEQKGYSIDDMLKVVKQNITLYNTEQENISPRIDEVRRSIPEEVDYTKLDEGLKKGNEYLQAIDAKLAKVKEQETTYLKNKNTAYELKSRMSEYKQSKLSELNEGRNKDLDLKSKLCVQIASINGQLDILNMKVRAEQDTIKDVSERLLEFKDSWDKATADKFEPIVAGVVACEKCGQILPANRIDDINKRAEDIFISTKKKRIDEITLKGKELSAYKKLHTEKLADWNTQKATLEHELEIATSQCKLLDNRLNDNLETADIDLSNDTEYMAMSKELESVSVVQENTENEAQLITSRAEVQDKVDQIKALIARKEQTETAQKRIAELTARGKELEQLISSEMHLKYKCEMFMRKKAELLQDNINSMFKNLSFRLFELQINGAIADDCTPVIRGIEYKDASNSERIRANIEIACAMQRAENIYCTLFIDNCEAATWIPKTECQLICLYVSAKDKELRLEVLDN